MGISNSIGSNVFDVLLCLGLPWFLKAAFFPVVPNEHYVTINSQGLVYSSISLFSTLAVLYVSLSLAKFKLTRSVGIACLVVYVIFLAFASILELNIFFVVNLPICVHWYLLRYRASLPICWQFLLNFGITARKLKCALRPFQYVYCPTYRRPIESVKHQRWRNVFWNSWTLTNLSIKHLRVRVTHARVYP